jgi:AcrR family transcriptional regulator
MAFSRRLSDPSPLADPGSSRGWEARAVARSLGGARERSVARARRLVAAARALAVERGDSDFTVAQVARRARLSLKTFYRQFASKDELLLALFEDDSRLGAARLGESVARVADPRARLRAFVAGLFALVAEGSSYSAVLVREHLRLSREHPAAMNQALAPLIDLLTGEIEAAAAKGAIRPDADRRDAVVVFNVVLAHVNAVVLGQLGDGREETVRLLWRFCDAALRPEPSS